MPFSVKPSLGNSNLHYQRQILMNFSIFGGMISAVAFVVSYQNGIKAGSNNKMPERWEEGYGDDFESRPEKQGDYGEGRRPYIAATEGQRDYGKECGGTKRLWRRVQSLMPSRTRFCSVKARSISHERWESIQLVAGHRPHRSLHFDLRAHPPISLGIKEGGGRE